MRGVDREQGMGLARATTLGTGDGGAARGTTFVELMGAITIISLATLVMLQQLTISYREGTVQQDRLWVYDKGTQILAELQSGIERGTIPDAEALHALADPALNPVLTTITDEYRNPLAPDHPMSGNWQRFGRWVWARQLEVTSPPGQDRIRMVKLKLVKYSDSGVPLVVTPLTTVLTLPRRTYPSTLVYDVYVLALSEVPSPLGSLAARRSALETRLRAASSEAPGIGFRVHWITRLGYGRDSLYTPYFNDVTPATAVQPRVYWYPMRIDSGSSLFNNQFFTGRLLTESGVVNGYSAGTCPVPHTIADQFNHAMRLPAARALFQARVAAGLEDAAEPPLQILLADMAETPDRYRNALILNLHGDGLPFPPVRNYSDAAAAAEVLPGVRVVAHAAKLCTPRDPNGDTSHADTEDVELRVYAFKQDPSAGNAVLAAPVTVQIFGGDFTSALSVRRLPGGIDVASGTASTSVAYSPFDSASGVSPTSDTGDFSMWSESGYSTTPSPHTWLRLHNTPLVCPVVAGQGLATNQRLYGMEYVPTPLGATPFVRDLAVPGVDAKNSARWRIRIGKAALGTVVPDADQMLTITTRIGTDTTTGTAWPIANQPRNSSTTYAWWARFESAVPALERYQFQGDPRHNPYADVAAAVGYNCCFAGSGIALHAPNWDAIDATRLRDLGFGQGVTSDMPRALSVWREALQAVGAVFTNLTPLANRLYLGGEIAAASTDGGVTPGKVVMPGAWFGQAGSVLVDSASDGPCVPAAPPTEPMASLVGEHIVVGSSGFWAKPWLGELYSDTHYADWFADGNVQTSVGYHREVRAQATPANLPTGTVFYGIGTGASAGPVGGTAFVQAGTPLNTFAHKYDATATSAITLPGRAMPDLLGYTWSAIPPAPYPFALSIAGDPTAPHFVAPAAFPVQTANLLETHFSSTGAPFLAGGVMSVADSATATMYLQLVSLSPPTPAEAEVLLDLSAAEQVRAFHVAGDPGLLVRIEQPARVEIVDPPKGALAQNPASITVTWSVGFMGIDGQPPTAAYPVGFKEDESALRYSVLCSLDSGSTWVHAIDGSPATAGVRPPPGLLLTDAGVGNESLTVATPPGSYPAGELLIRVEAFHQLRECHYGHHTVLVVVTR